MKKSIVTFVLMLTAFCATQANACIQCSGGQCFPDEWGYTVCTYIRLSTPSGEESFSCRGSGWCVSTPPPCIPGQFCPYASNTRFAPEAPQCAGAGSSIAEKLNVHPKASRVVACVESKSVADANYRTKNPSNELEIALAKLPLRNPS
jgi:hypothetical protein